MAATVHHSGLVIHGFRPFPVPVPTGPGMTFPNIGIWNRLRRLWSAGKPTLLFPYEQRSGWFGSNYQVRA